MKKMVACFISLALLLSGVAFAAENAEHGTPTDMQPTEVPVPVEEPVVTEAPTATPAATEEAVTPEATAVPTAVPEHKVVIALEHAGEQIHFGDQVTLRATLSGYEHAQYTVQWLLNGKPVEGANELTYTFTVTSALCGEWQLLVNTVD